MLSHTPGGARELSVTPTRPSAFPHRASRPAPGWIFYPGTAAEISDLQTQTRERSLPEPGSQPLGTRPFFLSPERGGSFRHPAHGAGQPQSASLARNVPVVAQMFHSSGLCSPGTDGRHGVQRDGSSRGIGGVFWRGREIASFGISFQPLASLPRPPRVLSAPLPLSGRCLCRDPLRECEEPVLQEHASACQERGAKHASRPPFSQDLQSRWLDAEFPRLCNSAGRVWSWCVERGGDEDWC